MSTGLANTAAAEKNGDGYEYRVVYSRRSRVRAWSFYAALGYVSVTVTVVGLTLKELAKRMGFVGDNASLQLHPIFLGRMFGALGGTLLGGLLCDLVSIKLLMFGCIILSSLSIAVLPHVAAFGIHALAGCFFFVGVFGSALVCAATTAACWAFPGKEVGPVLSGCAGAFGVSSAALPLLLWPIRGDVALEYAASAACGLPAIALLMMSSSPVKPTAPPLLENEGGDADGSCSAGNRPPWRHAASDWGMASLAALAQLLLQGTNASLLVWLVSFGNLEAHMGATADALVTVLQGGVCVGSLTAMRYQRRFKLLDLACVQLALVAAGAAAWLARTRSPVAAFAAVVWYGFVGGPTLGYSSSLYNQFTTPSGSQLSMINLGSNCGSGIAPFVTGLLMEHHGPRALVWTVFGMNSMVLAGMVILWMIARR